MPATGPRTGCVLLSAPLKAANQAGPDTVITYEYPLNERIRTLLRLEDLFGRIAHFSSSDDGHAHHCALLATFEVLEVASRADLKVDLVQELERQRQILLTFETIPRFPRRRFPAPCTKSNSPRLPCPWRERSASTSGKRVADGNKEPCRDSRWCMRIRLPSYHFWLNRDPELRRHDLEHWLAPVSPFATA